MTRCMRNTVVHRRSIRRAPALTAIVAALSLHALSLAQTPAPSTTSPPENQPTTDSLASQTGPAPATNSPEQEAAKKNALALFKEGRALYKKGQWSAALLQYEGSFRLYRTWEARTSVAACLVKLQRYDEALDVFESALREFGERLPPKTKTSALEQVDLMRRETGAVVVTGATPGALVFVDGRLRGEHPLSAPAPTIGGRHLVRVYKEGFVVFEKDVDISKGSMQALDVKLESLPHAGTLKVGEVGGMKMEVVVDGVPVGVTPWEGPVSPGPHSVALRPITVVDDPRSGSCDAATNALPPTTNKNGTLSEELGTEPTTVEVKEGATTAVALKAEPLGAVVRVMPNPPNADVYIDGVFVGRGPYVGRAKPGKHVVKMQAEGYFPVTQELDAKVGDEAAPPKANLRKDVNSPKWIVPGRVVVEVRGAVPLAPSFGGDIADDCTGDCQQSLGTGIRAALRVGYERGNGLGFGLSVGYLRMQQSRLDMPSKICTEDPAVCQSLDLASPSWQVAVANDSTQIETFVAGAYGSYKLGRRFPVRLGVGAGVLLGNVTYARTMIFENQAAGPLTQSGFFPWIYVEPEAQIGVQITERWSVGLTLSALVLIAPKVPTWTQNMLVNAHGDSVDTLVSFEKQRIAGSSFFTMSQGLYVQYGF